MEATEVLSRKRPRRRSVRILLDESLLEERDQLVLRIKRAEREELGSGGDWQSPLPGLRDALDELSARIEEETVEFVFQAMPRPEWYELVSEYEDALDSTAIPPEEFQRAVVQKSAHDPAWTKEQVDEIFEEWGTFEVDQIYLTAFAVNREIRNIPFIDADTGRTPSIGSNSTTAQNEESLTATS